MVEVSEEAPPAAAPSFCSYSRRRNTSTDLHPSKFLFHHGSFHNPHRQSAAPLFKTPPLSPLRLVPDLRNHSSSLSYPPQEPVKGKTGEECSRDNDQDSLLRRFTALAEGILSLWEGDDSIRERIERLARRQQALNEDITMIEHVHVDLQERVDMLEEQQEENVASLEKLREDRMHVSSEIRAIMASLNLQKDNVGNHRRYVYEPCKMVEDNDGWNNRFGLLCKVSTPGTSHSYNGKASCRMDEGESKKSYGVQNLGTSNAWTDHGRYTMGESGLMKGASRSSTMWGQGDLVKGRHGGGIETWTLDEGDLVNLSHDGGIRSCIIGKEGELVKGNGSRTFGSNPNAEPEICDGVKIVTAARKLNFTPSDQNPNCYTPKTTTMGQNPNAAEAKTMRFGVSDPRNQINNQESQMVAFEMLEFAHKRLTAHLLSYMWQKVRSMESEKEKGEYLELFRGGEGTPFAGKPLNEATYADLLSFASAGRSMEKEGNDEAKADVGRMRAGKGRHEVRKQIWEAMEAAEGGLAEEAIRQGYSADRIGDVRRQMGLYVRCHRQMKHMVGLQRRARAGSFTEGSVSEAAGAAMAGRLGALQEASLLVQLAAFFLLNKLCA